jgi:malate dehydrogenase
MKNRIRVAVTGAAGHIGYALVFRLASGQMFGPETEVELHLLELEQALPALEGVAMELEDCAFPLLKRVVCTSELKQGMDGINWALLVGSAPRKQGMERSDLLQMNGNIFTKQGKAINDYASQDVRIFVVGNPCNTNALIAMNHAKDIPQDRFYAMTRLDELRARAQLALKAQVSITDISHMTIWGNHSATQYPDFYQAKIQGKSAAEVLDKHWLEETFVPTVQQRGAAVIKARGSSSAGSAANAIVTGVHSLVHDTKPSETFSMCCASKGEYGVDEGLIFSYPCRVEKGILKVQENIPLNAYSEAKFQATLEELRQERDLVRGMGLLDS